MVVAGVPTGEGGTGEEEEGATAAEGVVVEGGLVTTVPVEAAVGSSLVVGCWCCNFYDVFCCLFVEGRAGEGMKSRLPAMIFPHVRDRPVSEAVLPDMQHGIIRTK